MKAIYQGLECGAGNELQVDKEVCNNRGNGKGAAPEKFLEPRPIIQ